MEKLIMMKVKSFTLSCILYLGGREMRKKIIGLCLVFMFILMSYGQVGADVFDDFESRTPGAYVNQTTAWRYLYNLPGLAESPMVAADGNAFSGSSG